MNKLLTVIILVVSLCFILAACDRSQGNGDNVNYSQGLEFVSNGDGTCFVNGIGSCTYTHIKVPPYLLRAKVLSLLAKPPLTNLIT